MRKNLLALSIAAMVGGLSGVANAAVVVDTVGGRVIGNTAPFGKLVEPGVAGSATTALAATRLSTSTTGIGHILFVPYFTTQDNNMTMLNLVNTDQKNGKAVKLRVRGAANSDDLFDISIYLSPGDVWTANLMANGDVSSLITNDTSCSLPSAAQIKENAGKFSLSRVKGDAAQTREGYVEILNMADIPVNLAVNSLYTAIKHVNGKAPCKQEVMDMQAKPLVANDIENDPVARGYSWPTGGLMANWTIVNVATKASFSGEAVALRATPSNVVNEEGAANLVFSPQTDAPVDNAVFLTADPLLNTGKVRAGSYDFPDLSTPYTNAVGSPIAQANELAAALATHSVSNEYITDPTVNFATDWVFSMPSRRYAVALDYENPAAIATSPSDFFSSDKMSGNVSLNSEKTRLCVDSGQMVGFDREEQSRTTFVISPFTTVKFCGETSVLTFNGKPSVLGAKLTVANIETKFADGWLQIKTPGIKTVKVAGQPATSNGLPVVGYAVGKAIGSDGGNFGGTWQHRTNRFNNQPF